LGDKQTDSISISPERNQDNFEGLWNTENDREALARLVKSKDPTYFLEIQEAADAICNRKFVFLGVPVEYPQRIQWKADPLSGREWPDKFHTRINIFSGDKDYGDVKYVWELNRHQFLIILSKAYCLTGKDEYASTALDMMTDWIRANSYKMGINWTSALGVSVRSISWCWVYSLLQNAKAFDSEKRHQVIHSLFQHGLYINDHLSFFFSPSSPSPIIGMDPSGRIMYIENSKAFSSKAQRFLGTDKPDRRLNKTACR